uniref:Helicase ATP-binding domain-containing protein n=1 Tax=Strongyloides venezuelensis TaxID=75913 RepID=A0A0K0FPW3_STRVS
MLPIIDAMLKSELKSGERVPFALIIAPTRELVLRIHEQIRKFCNRSQYGCAKLYKRINIIVTTPERLNEFFFKGYVHPKKTPLCGFR